MDVGVRELKARLSEFLDLAERGEIVRVTDRGRPKAVLGPLPGRDNVQDGVAAGWITAASGAPLAPVRRRAATGRVLDALDEDRGA